MSVGELIKEYLAEAGISQKWLSNRTGIATAKLNLALHGKRRMTFEEYALICGTLGVNTDTLKSLICCNMPVGLLDVCFPAPRYLHNINNQWALSMSYAFLCRNANNQIWLSCV